MARPAIVIALPPSEQVPVAGGAARGRLRGDPDRCARRARGAPRQPPRHRRRDPRRRERLRHVARVLRPAPRGRPRRSRPSWSCRRRRSTGCVRPSRRSATTSSSAGPTPPTRSAGGSRRCASGRSPSTTAPGRSSRAARWRWATGRGGRPSSRSSTRRAASARRRSRRTSPSALQLHHGQQVLLVDADTVTGHVTTSLGLEQASGPSPTAGASQADDGIAETLTELASAASVGDVGRVADRVAAEHRDPRARPGRRRDHDVAAGLRLHRRRPAPVVQRPQPGRLREGRRDPRPGHAGRARPARRRPAPRRRDRARRRRIGSRWSSTAPTAACPSPTWSGPSGCRPSP